MSEVPATADNRVHHVLRHPRRHSLDPLFAPRSMAIIGASEAPGSIGRALVENLKPSGRPLYAVNPRHASVMGLPTYPTISQVPEPVDLVVIATPAGTVSGIIRECVACHVPGAVIISAGFKETGESGVKLEQEVLAEARKGKMRLLGPNCLGLMMPHAGLNASFSGAMAKPGSVAFLSQSGALCTAVLDWSLQEKVGFSGFVSSGSMLDVGWGDLIYYFGDDPHTKSILCYMESVGDARQFLSAAREVALSKPIIVLKVGHSEAAARAAASHTGSLTGSDAVLDAAFRRVGVLRVNTLGELFDMAEVLSKQPRPRGPRLAIVTNAGGPGALATDMLVSSGGKLATLSQKTLASLDTVLPPHWSHGNPIDVLGDADVQRYIGAAEIALREPEADGLCVILTPQAMTDPTATAEKLAAACRGQTKPIVASWMGGAAVEEGRAILAGAGIPTYDFPDTAARAFSLMWRYGDNLRSLYETPGSDALPRVGSEAQNSVRELLLSVQQANRTLLTEPESKQVLAAYGIPTVETKTARTAAEAVRIAETMGFPVAVKLVSETVTHKTDVGGVCLDVRNAAGVRHAWQSIEESVKEHVGSGHFLGVTVQPMIPLGGTELILGSSIDAQFGPVILFGAGGRYVEIFKDRALGLPPLNATLARRLMEQTRVFEMLKGVRGQKAADLPALEQLVVRFSHLVIDQPWIVEIDINPLLVSSGGMVALDARMVVHPLGTLEKQLPKPAIRPYPSQYIQPCNLGDGSTTVIRPIRPEDEPALVRFHQSLSGQSVYQRYFSMLSLDQRTAHERLSRICFIDYDCEMALAVERQDPATGQSEILGMGRLSKLHGTNRAELAMLVRDEWQGRGLGMQLVQMLIKVAADEHVERIFATVLLSNGAMQALLRKAGFRVRWEVGEGECTAELDL